MTTTTTTATDYADMATITTINTTVSVHAVFGYQVFFCLCTKQDARITIDSQENQ